MNDTCVGRIFDFINEIELKFSQIFLIPLLIETGFFIA